MKSLLVLIVVLVAGCSGGSGTTAHGAAATWPIKWCQAQPGISKEQLIGIMGQPTNASPTQMTWADDDYRFYAFLEADGSVRQLDINQASLTEAEKAGLQCGDVRTKRSMAAQAQAPVAPARPACEIISQVRMSEIVGVTVVAQADGRSKCIYKPDAASLPYVEFSFDRGDGAAGMAGVGFADKSQPGLTNPLDGLGDQAVGVGPALFIRTGDDLVTLVLSGVKDKRTAASKILEAAKAGT